MFSTPPAGGGDRDVDVTASARLQVRPTTVFAAVANLATYPDWIGIVHSAHQAPPHPDDPGPAWTVDLGARLGPLRRSKRVRMVRTACDQRAGWVRAERMEHDGGSHSAWMLSA